MTCPVGACVSCDLQRNAPVRSEDIPAVKGPALEYRRVLPHEVHALKEQGWHAAVEGRRAGAVTVVMVRT
jgi:hypothetical protein